MTDKGIKEGIIVVKEEVELLPAGLVTCLLDESEVRILKISPETITIRTANEEIINENTTIKVVFFVFDEYRYEEVVLKDYNLLEKRQERFSFTYTFAIDNKVYLENVRRVTKDYTRYIMLKNYGHENEFSNEMVGYPEELDYEFYNFYSQQKRDWILDINYEPWEKEDVPKFELAVSVDNDRLYKKYLSRDIYEFKDEYLKENHVKNHKLFEGDISRIYIGNEFCHNLFPNENILFNMIDKARNEKLAITICFTYLRNCYIEKTKSILEKLYNWCEKNQKEIEIVINDWGILNLIKDKHKYFKVSLGVLLNKRKKDPRYIYKKGYSENIELMSKNSLNSSYFSEYLKRYNIERYEYENCGYKMSIARGKHSLHMPFYQTNTSQYCTLYAMCENMDRGKQMLVKSCPKYCTDYIFSYPKHLKMVGRYNSLFAFDDTLLSNPEELKYYINNGIDRIVLNFV